MVRIPAAAARSDTGWCPAKQEKLAVAVCRSIAAI